MNKRNIITDFLIYLFASTKGLLFKGDLLNFTHDLSSFFFWRSFRYSKNNTLEHRIPWLVCRTIKYLKKKIKPDMIIFEYGSGGSTLFFANKGSSVISVEHDTSWYLHTKNEILSAALTNIEYKLREPVKDTSTVPKSYLDPTHFISAFSEYEGYEFSSYARAIEDYPDQYFDLVVIDGRVRSSCIMLAIKKIKQHGILLLDNADRLHYTATFPELTDGVRWKLEKHIGHFPFGPASVINHTYIYKKAY